MKRIFLLLAVVLAIFCFGSAAMAEGFTVSGDLTLGSPNDGGTDDLGYLTIGGDFDLDPFFIGGSLLVCVYKDPPLADTEEAMTYLYGVYGGYTLLNSDSFRLAALAGYYLYNQDYTDSVGPVEFNWDASSLMVGVKAAFNADPISVSFIYMYGVANESSVDSTYGTNEVADPAFSWFELKGSYALNEAWSIYGVYRGFTVDAPVFTGVWSADDAGSTIYGVGLNYKF